MTPDALGLSSAQAAQLRFLDRVEALIARHGLHLEIAGFSAKMPATQEFRLQRGRKPGHGAVMFNPRFWAAHGYDDERFLSYVLFRAEAAYFYRSHFDAE